MVYSTDDFGTPSGIDTLDRPENPETHLWRTVVSGRWFGLAVYEGLPPQSITGRPRPLNGGDFMVDIPLVEGENFFTIVGEPGPITATDQYQRFAVNLYFDGGLTTPGISVLFPRYAPEEGGAVSPNRSMFIYSFDVNTTQVRSPGVDDQGLDVYDDGIDRVTVTAASFLPEDRFLSIDLVAGNGFRASGVSDFVGSLVILVEPSEGGPVVGGLNPGAGGIGSGPGGRARSGLPGSGGGGRDAGGVGGPGFVGSAPRAAPLEDAPEVYDDPGLAAPAAMDEEPAEEPYEEPESTPTPRDAIGALRNWLQAAVGTATETPGVSTPTPGVAGTPTPMAAATPDGSPSPTAARTTTGAPTGSPAPTGSITPTPTRTPQPTTAVPDGTPKPTDEGERAGGESESGA